MKLPRSSGVLLHLTSLPGAHGIGDMGPEAYRFVDWLASAGQQLWQILPLGPVGYGNSPYASSSAFAGNPDLISPERLVDDGLLSQDQLEHDLPQEYVDFENFRTFKHALMTHAFGQFRPNREYNSFLESAHYWLDDFVRIGAQDGESPDFLRFVQFQFVRQWSALKRYANEHGVRIVGDIPIFVAEGSVDVRAHPDLFYVDAAGHPTEVAGVPPDLFSETGQRWGNPHYRWDAMAKDGFKWWADRLRRTLELVDIVRIDHFRGLAAYWSILATEETAVRGEWKQGPGSVLLTTIGQELGELPIIVEDLGLITTDVMELKETLGYPGMKVLQFAFDGKSDNPYLPHNYAPDCVVYTGTHDNDTTVGWYESLPEDTRDHLRRYLSTDANDPAWDLIRVAQASVARFAIFPVQDLLSLGNDARLNFPGKPDGNWSWRLQPGALTAEVAARLRAETALYGRLPVAPRPPERVKNYPFGMAAINSGL